MRFLDIVNSFRWDEKSPWKGCRSGPGGVALAAAPLAGALDAGWGVASLVIGAAALMTPGRFAAPRGFAFGARGTAPAAAGRRRRLGGGGWVPEAVRRRRPQRLHPASQAR